MGSKISGTGVKLSKQPEAWRTAGKPDSRGQRKLEWAQDAEESGEADSRVADDRLEPDTVNSDSGHDVPTTSLAAIETPARAQPPADTASTDSAGPRLDVPPPVGQGFNNWDFVLGGVGIATGAGLAYRGARHPVGVGNDGESLPASGAVVDQEAPVFLSGANVQALLARTGTGQLVYVAHATDVSPIRYALKAGTDASFFTVDEKTGAVTMIAPPDWSRQPIYSFTVIAVDAAGNTREQPVRLEIVPRELATQYLPSGETLQLEVPGSGEGEELSPHLVALGGEGAYVAVWLGQDTSGAWQVWAQPFAADGSPSQPLRLGGIDAASASRVSPQACALGTDGAFAVAWQNHNDEGGDSLSVHLFNADGSLRNSVPLSLTAGASDGHHNARVQIHSLGSEGAFVVVWEGTDADGQTSVLVQRFNAEGSSVTDAAIRLSPEAFPDSHGSHPQVAELGTQGAFVVVWQGETVYPEQLIFVQAFNADGSLRHTPQPLSAHGLERDPVVAAVGTEGAFVVAWQGADSDRHWDDDFGDFYADASVFLQIFNADGTPSDQGIVKLEATDRTDGDDLSPQICSLGSSGAFAVAWQGVDAESDMSIFVQAFTPEGSPATAKPVQLEAIGQTAGADTQPRICAVGVDGAFVVTWQGVDDQGGTSIFVQAFHADGSMNGHVPVQFPVLGMSDSADTALQIGSLSADGMFAVAWQGHDRQGDYSVFVQKFLPGYVEPFAGLHGEWRLPYDTASAF